MVSQLKTLKKSHTNLTFDGLAQDLLHPDVVAIWKKSPSSLI